MGDKNLFGEETSATSIPSTLQPVLPLEVGEMSIIIRPERNLEKWPIWEASNSRHQMQERMLQREIRLPDGSVAIARVKVGYTNNGALTTEDQKTCYALFRIWEEANKPPGPIYFSRQQLARVLKKSWGSKTNKAITASLMRLRFTPFEWERSYYDSARDETVERIDTFNILSELNLVRRTRGETTLSESSSFQFNERILANLRAGFTRPVYLDTILNFQSEIAQILYTFLDLIMVDKPHYERRSKELFEDMGIDGTSYRYPSKRAELLERALVELTDVPVPTGTLTVTLERTVDRQDFKIVVKKTRKRNVRTREEKEVQGTLTLPLSLPLADLAPPVVTRVVNAPVDVRKQLDKRQSESRKKDTLETGKADTSKPSAKPALKAPKRPVEASEASTDTNISTRGKRPEKSPFLSNLSSNLSSNISSDISEEPEETLTKQARRQVRHFYQVFFQAGETARPTRREFDQAKDHVSRLGQEKAEYVVQFARREAKKTGFEIQNYAGVAQYEGRAVAEYDANEKQRQAALTQRVRESHRQRHNSAYLDYLRECMTRLEIDPPADFAEFLESERRARERLKMGKLADTATVRRVLQTFDAPEARLERFREFLRERKDRGAEVADVLPFWEWDAVFNPEGLERVTLSDVR